MIGALSAVFGIASQIGGFAASSAQTAATNRDRLNQWKMQQTEYMSKGFDAYSRYNLSKAKHYDQLTNNLEAYGDTVFAGGRKADQITRAGLYAQQDANIVSAVAGLGRTALENSGTTISVSDNGYVNTGSYTDDNSVIDSYNTTDNSTDNSADNSDNSTDNSADSTTNNYAGDEYVTNEYVTNEYVTYEGQEFTLAGLLEYLRGTGLAYNLTIGDTTYTVDGEGEPTDIDCVEPGVPQFSPSLPVCES